jgi:phosphoesterase RecJ-like protein
MTVQTDISENTASARLDGACAPARDASASGGYAGPGADFAAPSAAELIATLLAAERVVVVSHLKPDGDAYGSALALAGLLRAAGKRTVVTGLQPASPTYSFLKGYEEIVPAADFVSKPGDVLAICDSAAPDRIAAELRPLLDRLPSVCIDHHKTNDGFTTRSYIDASASSTSELVWRIARQADWPLAPAVAEALWAGIVTDTGRFAYDCTAPTTLRAAADLLENGGVRSAELNEHLFGQFSLRQIRLQREALASLTLSDDGRIGMISLTQADYDACGATSVDSENFVDIVRAVEGVEVAVFLYAGAFGKATRVSLRTRPPYDASEFCQRLGGGGHARAAGATIEAPVEETRAEVMQALNKWINSH